MQGGCKSGILGEFSESEKLEEFCAVPHDKYCSKQKVSPGAFSEGAKML